MNLIFSETSVSIKKLRELEYLAFHDDMTKLRNRHFLFREIDVMKFKFMYFIDINGLKKVNENGGHFAGDTHIRKIVKEIKSLLSVNDVFIRYAGDEFIVLSNDDNKLTSTILYSVGKSKTTKKLVPTIKKANKDLIDKKHGKS
jgi:diguanylate cyclase (GGDEF)-like protein